MQDDRDFANRFVRDLPTPNVEMYWESGGTKNTWGHLGVPFQPAWMLLDRFGQKLISAKTGSIDESEVLETISA